ncbi:hypothetical protein P8452_43100 [Trifolium repens]|nr:hypothetical protein P8452_43100 [Trifolium repens]
MLCTSGSGSIYLTSPSRSEYSCRSTTFCGWDLQFIITKKKTLEAESQKPKHRNPLFFFFISRRPSLFFFISRPFCSPPPPKIMSESGSVAQPSQPSLPTQNEELEAQLQSSRQKTDPAWDYCIYKVVGKKKTYTYDIEFWIMEEDTNSTPILDANEIESMLYNEESIPIIGRLENDEGELAPTIGLEDGRLNLDSFPQEDVNSYSGDDGFHQFAD